jgi:hypothetical protein
MLVHLVTKLGTAANDAATSLKLLEKGLKKEDLALAVLIDFPFQILFGYLAAKWSKGDKPLKPVSLLSVPRPKKCTRRSRTSASSVSRARGG